MTNRRSSSFCLMHQRPMASASSCGHSIGGHLTTRSRKRAGECCGTTPLRLGRPCRRRAGGAVLRLCDSHHLDMTRPQRIAVTSFLSALFVSMLFFLPFWCVSSEGMKSLLWDLSYSTPPLVTTFVTWVIPLTVFAFLCSVFAWVIARIWR